MTQPIRADFIQDLREINASFLKNNALRIARHREIEEQIEKLRWESGDLLTAIKNDLDALKSPLERELL